MEKAALDVFAVTESRLDCTLLDSKICPSGYTCYRIEMEVVAPFL